jgi:hypothetical protein
VDQVPDTGEEVGIDIVDALVRAIGRLLEKILLRARPARIKHLPELQDREEDDTPDDCDEQRADWPTCRKEIVEMQHQAKRENIADPKDLRFRVIGAHH